MKYLYVLASTDKDIYVEQAFISITSLRIHNKNAFVSLLIDDETDKNLGERKFKLKELVNEIVVIAFDKAVDQIDKSRQLKTNMRNLIRGDFLYIDSDTVICENLDEIWNCEYSLAAIPDSHMDFDYTLIHEKACRMFWKTSKKIPIERFYFNSGVLLVKECKKNFDFFNKWNELWNLYKYKSIFSDQISLAFANAWFKFPISELDGIWNCQVQFGSNYFRNAKILHYFATNNFEYGNFRKKISMSLKKLGFLTKDYLQEIENPKYRFPTPHLIISGNDYEIFRSKIVTFFSRRTKIFFTLEKIFCFVRNIWLKVRGVK